MAQFVTVARTEDIEVGGSKRVIIGDYRLAIFHTEDGYYVIDDTCSHAEASLSEGCLSGHIVQCPRHGAKFDIKTGKALSLPAFKPVASYRVQVQNGEIQVELEDLEK